jgi:hypothetical protein
MSGLLLYRHGPITNRACTGGRQNGVVWWRVLLNFLWQKGSFFSIHYTAHNLLPLISTSTQPSNFPSVGTCLGMTMAWRNDEVGNTTIFKLIQEGNRRSCFSLSQRCRSWSTVCRKLRRVTHPPIYPTSTVKELCNKLAAIKKCVAKLAGQTSYIQNTNSLF